MTRRERCTHCGRVIHGTRREGSRSSQGRSALVWSDGHGSGNSINERSERPPESMPEVSATTVVGFASRDDSEPAEAGRIPIQIQV